MEQKRKPFQELIKDGRMSEENTGNSVEVNSVEELTELLQQTAEDGTMLSLMVEQSGDMSSAFLNNF